MSHRTRFPRTMQEAFGPYTSDQLCGMPDTRPVYWTPIRVAFALTYAAALFVLWWTL